MLARLGCAVGLESAEHGVCTALSTKGVCLRFKRESSMDFITFSPRDLTSGVGKWASIINKQAKVAHVPPCALAAIVANETGGQNIFQAGVPRGPGCGVGLAQITAGVDWDNVDQPAYHDPQGKTWLLLAPPSNLYVAAQWFLAPAIDECEALRAARPGTMAFWSPEILFFAFAAYNEGYGKLRNAVLENENPDRFTTDDYATRAMAFYRQYLSEAHIP